MTYSLSWMADVLKDAKQKVAEQPGWKTRGRSDVGRIEIIICHHTAGGLQGNMPSLGTITNGRGGRNPLAGPLANLGLGRDGTWYVVAAGRANHAGAGQWAGCTNGNSEGIGIEAENNGVGEPWAEVMLDAYRHGCAAMCKHLGLDANRVCGHREYALPKGRKIDPTGIDMAAFRREVAAIMGGFAPAPILVPVVDAKSRPTIRRGDHGVAVKLLQKALKLDDDGVFGGKTEAAVRAWQRKRDIVPDGIVGPRTWASLEGSL